MQPHKFQEKKETDLGAWDCMNHATVLFKNPLQQNISYIFNWLTNSLIKEHF